jgi:hypothetical protein
MTQSHAAGLSRRFTLTDDTKEHHSKERTKAEAQFKKAPKPQPAGQPTTKAGRAKADYVAAGNAERAKTVRLRAQRLTKEAAHKKKK